MEMVGTMADSSPYCLYYRYYIVVAVPTLLTGHHKDLAQSTQDATKQLVGAPKDRTRDPTQSSMSFL
jgi:hypothetical protein